MTEARSVSADVNVPVDPTTAFKAFTQELDLWWVRGPINYFDAARAVAMVCEPGVGEQAHRGVRRGYRGGPRTGADHRVGAGGPVVMDQFG